jgi:hypothetical protein
MMRIRTTARFPSSSRLGFPLLALVGTLVLGGCLQDFAGGPARVQVTNGGVDTVTAMSIDAWRHDFVPVLAPDRTSETVELPVSGRLQVNLHGTREGRDTVLSRRIIDAGVGEFVRIDEYPPRTTP